MKAGLLLSCFLFVAVPALADTVHLKNGDRLTGEVLFMTNKALKFRTEYAGEISIQWESVENLSMDKSLPVHLEDGQSINGKLLVDENGNPVLHSDTFGVMGIELGKIAGINPPPVEEKPLWSGSLKFRSAVTKGNTDTLNVGFSGEAVYETDRDKVRFFASTDYQETERVETVRNVKGGLKFDHTFHEHLYGFGLLDLEYDKFRDLDLRTKAGVGVGYKILDEDRHQLDGEFGFMWVEENYDKGEDDGYASLRLAEEYSWKVSDRCSFVQRWEYIPSLEHFSDYLMNFAAAFQTGITKNLFWEIGVEDSYNSDPPSRDVERNDFKGYMAIGVKF